MDIDELKSHKGSIDEFAARLKPEDIASLVSLLTEKMDEIRFPVFQALLKRSQQKPDVYPFWGEFAAKLTDENSFQRSIGIMLIAENVRWDQRKLFGDVFKSYISHCMDEKFITSRQTIQSIPRWVEFAPELLDETIAYLTSIDLGVFKDTQRKLILVDILNSLAAICEIHPSGRIAEYASRAITGGILDRKTARQFEGLLGETASGGFCV